jgi:amino acid adenylation domain-containing protein
VRFHAQVREPRLFQFIISFHHSCLDGWSLAAVMTEIFQDYMNLRDCGGERPAPPRITYRDFVALEQLAIANAESRRFWLERLEGASAQNLPRWPKSLRSGGYEQARGPEIQVEANVFSGLKVLAQTAGVPLKTVLLAAHQRVMSFLSGQADIISGLICNGRPEEIDGEKLIGLFLNTLPLRQNVCGGTWLELIKETFSAEQQLLPHRRFPLAEVQKLTGGKPLFETAFDFVHFHVYRNLQECRGLDLAEGHYFEANNLTTYTTFMVDLNSTRLELHIDYDPNVLSREQIELMSQYYVSTLKAMASDPGGLYELFSPISEGEVHILLREWNSTAEDYPRDQTLSDLFDEQVHQRTKAIALVCEDKQFTYGDLAQRVDQLARHLHSLNLEPGELVGLCPERSPEMVIALLAILKVGGVYVPLDPAYPQERLAFMTTDANLRLVLTQRSLLGTLPASAATTVCIEEVLNGKESRPAGHNKSWSKRVEENAPTPNARPLLPSNPSDLAYVIYTSGSTGRPKGVQVTHLSVVNLLTSVARKTGFTAQDNLLAVTTLSFDIAGLEIFLPLITGARLTLAGRDTAANGTVLASLIDSSAATVMQATPSTWRLLIEAGWRGNKNLTVFCGGEALSRGLADALLGRAREVWNFFGPTETTIWSTAWKVQPDEPVLIGRPLANTDCYILDAKLRPVPVGVAGELHIGGDGVAEGYLNRPELTAERFIANPFAAVPGQRLYKSGDLVRYLPDGQMECLGRMDQQVKIRGFRIEPGEVEATLRQHKGIADALVASRTDGLGEKRFVGYLISNNGPPSLIELRDFLRAKLPLYMVPTQFVTLQQFPLTPNGKVDIRRLPAPENERLSSRAYTAPNTAEEKTLAEIWSEVLALKEVGIDDYFFDLGGDSLSATRAFARINTTFGTELTLREILERPTIRALSELVKNCKQPAEVPRSIIPRQPRSPSRS